MIATGLTILELMQLADSALPIGTAAHSLGLEMLVEDGTLTMQNLRTFFADYIIESGTFEATYCRAAYEFGKAGLHPQPLSHIYTDEERLATRGLTADSLSLFTERALRGEVAILSTWLSLNHRLDAIKTARESRAASTALGRRFLQLVIDLEPLPILLSAQQSAKAAGVNIHHSTAFGLVCGALGFDLDLSILAYLQQSVASLISACQRLMPLGQTQASALLWRLKPTMLDALARSDQPIEDAALFTPLIEAGSMRHPLLTTRLFIS
jgi:urease accessory protein